MHSKPQLYYKVCMHSKPQLYYKVRMHSKPQLYYKVRMHSKPLLYYKVRMHSKPLLYYKVRMHSKPLLYYKVRMHIVPHRPSIHREFMHTCTHTHALALSGFCAARTACSLASPMRDGTYLSTQCARFRFVAFVAGAGPAALLAAAAATSRSVAIEDISRYLSKYK